MIRAPKDDILEEPSETMYAICTMYGLNNEKVMDEAVTTLDEWVKKQNHFLKKDFSKEYLGRIILNSKGSVERAKRRIEKTSTFRTLFPKFFEEFKSVEDFKQVSNTGYFAILPKFAPNFNRVCILKLNNTMNKSTGFLYVYRYLVMMCEYLRDNGNYSECTFIIDYRDINLIDLISTINLTELHQASCLYIEGYGMIVKGIHLICESKVTEKFVSILRPILSKKISGRLHVHRSEETLRDYFPKEILPLEYGGDEKSILILHAEQWLEFLGSAEFMKYMREVNKAGTNEVARPRGKLSEEYMGVSGTFRTLNVD